MTDHQIPEHSGTDQPWTRVALGIAPVDRRTGGLEPGGSYLVVGPPGPAKLVALLHFVDQGLQNGEKCLLLTGGDARSVLFAARGWGMELEEPWRSGQLEILGFRDDFELRAARTIAPEEVLVELADQVPPETTRVAVDPGTLFLAGGGKTLLGGAFLRWTRDLEATVCTSFSVDGEDGGLPSTADWFIHGTTGRLVLSPRTGGLLQLTLIPSIPHGTDEEEPVSLQLKPGEGLVAPDAFPSRRDADRGGLDPGRLLLVSLAGQHAADLETWARTAFDTAVVSEPFEAVSRVQDDTGFGTVLIHASRGSVREAVQASRAIRPLTRAALIFASDDVIRSADRIQLLEAGADDCLSGGLDFRELGLRIRQAVTAGSRPATAAGQDGEEGPAGGAVPPEVLRDEVRQRSEDPMLGVFCVLILGWEGEGEEAFHDLLAQEIRDRDGDLVAREGGRWFVVLQGARESQTEPFLARFRRRLQATFQGDSDLSVEVLGHPSRRDRITSLLGDAGAGRD